MIKQGFSLPKPDTSKFDGNRWIIGTLFAPLIMVLLKTRWMMVKGCRTCYSFGCYNIPSGWVEVTDIKSYERVLGFITNCLKTFHDI